MTPRVMAGDRTCRPDYLAGVWDYAKGMAAVEHRRYRRAVSMADRAGWDSGWIRTWQDVEATLAGCRFDIDSADRVVMYFSMLRHYKGQRWAGKPFTLLDWWKYDVIMPLFGWKTAAGLRRYRRGSVWVPKKNGKTTVFSGCLCYLLGFDNESGAEVYSAAVDRDQAGRLYRDARQMIRRSPALDRSKMFHFVDSTKTIQHVTSSSVYRALSSDANKSEGLDIYALFFDEIHALKNPDLWKVTFHGDIARDQSLFMAMSTAGEYDPNAVGYSEFEYAKKVRDAAITDTEYFSYIAAAEPESDWTDPAVWKRANPSWGVIVLEDELKKKFRRAVEKPDEQADFKRYRLNIWIREVTKYLDIDAWRAKCGGPLTDDMLAGARCWGGVDLSSTTDLTAVCWVFELPDGVYGARWRFWMPDECIIRAGHRDKAPYGLWAEQGYIETTPGNVTDYNYVKQALREDAEKYGAIEIGYDPWNAEATMLDLQEQSGLTVVKVAQVGRELNWPMKSLQAMAAGGSLRHGDNPVALWMADNLVARTDPNGNCAPDKKKSISRIDGMAALVTALNRALGPQEAEYIEYTGLG